MNDSGTPTPSTPTESSVQFINQEVLNQPTSSMPDISIPLVEQAAGMMIQDAQVFLQSNEQIFTAGMAQAIALLLNPATSETGQTALTTMSTALTALTTFSATVGTTASGIVSDFGTSGSGQ